MRMRIYFGSQVLAEVELPEVREHGRTRAIAAGDAITVAAYEPNPDGPPRPLFMNGRLEKT